MTDVLLIVILILVLINTIIIIRVLTVKKQDDSPIIETGFDNIEKQLLRQETQFKEELKINRQELGAQIRENREELNLSHKTFNDTFIRFNDSIIKSISESSKAQKEQLDSFTKLLNENIKNTNDLMRNITSDLVNMQSKMNNSTEEKLVKMRETIENKLKSIQEDNSKKLDEMRATVDEKLQSTLEKRLSESFKQVSERLEQVHKGLGEMQNLATGVGDLKKVLTNVKQKGVLGEYQLENILEQILTAEQYSKNVKTKEGSAAIVEFAIKLPGRDDKNKPVWLPVDSKFPTEDYQSLIEAYEQGDVKLIEENTKKLQQTIKRCAKDIYEKYISPPDTTDFALMFMPFEGLYAEVLRVPGLFEFLQREYRVIITGPTTLSALLNSLQMGFRTLAIEKRSSEVWEILGAVKTEFANFGNIIKKAQDKINAANKDLDDLVGKRSRAIERKLRDVHQLTEQDATNILGDDTD